MRVRSTRLWRHPEFLKLWGSDTISLFGVHATLLALPLTAAALGASALQVGLLTTAQAAPALLLGLFAGVWVDRRRRRPLLVGANVARAVALGSIPLAAHLGTLHLAQLYTVAFLSGTGAIVFVVAYQSFLPTVVPREHLVAGNSALRGSEATAQLARPSIGGLLVPLLTAPPTLAVGALASLGSALALLAIRTPEPPPAPPGDGAHVGRAIGEGVRFVLGHPILCPLLISATVSALFGNMIVSISVLYVIRDLGLPAWAFGVIVGTGGPAALGGAILTGRVLRRYGTGRTLIGTAIVSGAAALLVSLAGGPFLMAVVLLIAWHILTGLAEAVSGIANATLTQTIPPPRLQGRVNATMRVFGWGAVALGGLLDGTIGEMIGLRPTMALAAIGMLLVPLRLARSPVRTLRESPESIGSGSTMQSPPTTE